MNKNLHKQHILAEKLHHRLFLSSMMGITDSTWSAEHCKNAAMVQLGAFVLDAPMKKSGVYWPPSDKEKLTSHLRTEFENFKNLYKTKYGGTQYPLLCANIFLCEEKSVASSAESFMKAGGDIYELNVHGGIGKDRERGTGHAMFFPEHVEKLYRWIRILTETGVVLVVKARAGVIQDYSEHLKKFEQLGVFGFHINVRDEKRGVQDWKCLEKIRKETKLFLMASGYVKDAKTAKQLFDSGADAVGIAEAVRTDPEIFDTISKGLKLS